VQGEAGTAEAQLSRDRAKHLEPPLFHGTIL
jgi:hypothetical protein